MASRRLLFSAALLFLFISAEVSTILAQNNGNNNGNNNSGNNNGSNNNGNNNGNNNNGNDNGNNNNGDNNGNGNNGSNNGNGNTGSNNGNGNNNSGQGNGNTGDGHGNGNNGNGNDSGTSGNGNGNTGSNNGNGNSGNNNGNGNNGNGNGNGNGNKTNPYPHDAASTNYTPVSRRPGTNEERFFCLARGRCHYNTLTCPSECPERKPRNNKRQKGCFVDCSSKCEVTCKWRRPRCNGYGALCYDPRFVGGDGVMFYFHGGKGSDFAIVSDEKFQINAHFIGSRPQGRTRDFTWVQALSVMFDTHTLVLAAKKVSHWENDVDALIVKWDGESVVVPMDRDAEWRVNAGEREAVVERTDDVNTVRVTVSGLLEMDMRVVPIGEEENRVHKYQLPTNDAFAHLETQFKFFGLTDLVEGVLGKTYRPGYVSPVKRGVPMPMMGGEDKYLTASLYSIACKVCRFERPLALAAAE